MDLSKFSIEFIDGYEVQTCRDGWVQKDKILPYMTIVYPYKGYYEVALGDNPLSCLPHGGGCYITAPGARHTIVHRMSPGEDWMMPRWLRLSVMYDHVLDATAWFEPPLLVTGDDAKPLIEAVDQLVALRQLSPQEQIFPKLRIAANVLEQLFRLCKFHPAALELEQIYPAILLIKDRYSAPLTVEQLANACAMSQATFYRSFRRIIHKTPIQYLDEYRLKQAAQLILENEKLSVIAEACGFCDAFHLSRNFKRHYGVSPKKYRQHTIL